MNALVTISIGKEYEELAQITHPTFKRYAEEIGAEFICIDTQKISQTTPHWEKFQLFDLFNKYERIVYIDADCIIRPDCPDLLKLVPRDNLGMFNEGAFADRSYAMTLARDEYGIRIEDWNGCYFNSGVIVASRQHKFLFKKPEKEIPHFFEQTYLNVAIHQNKVKMFNLHYKFNRMTCLDAPTGEERHGSFIIHYAGAPIAFDALSNLVQQDVEKWENDAPNWEYQRHILIDVRGGLGDQVDAEPTIRYALKHIWPDDDVRVITHWPELFAHLGCPVCKQGEAQLPPDIPFHHRITLTEPDKGAIWTFLSNLLCHTVDFASISVLRRILPDADKQIKLVVKPTDIANIIKITGSIDLRELVLVHAGRHWESKTIPIDYWQEIVDKLHNIGHKICLIGKEHAPDNEPRGYQPVIVREGMVDLRDLLDLRGLIALISQARVLISNDSAPIHIAGAFDNEIILIPTCKHPDHILPWRKGDKYYKAKAFYKRLSLDDVPSAPTCIEGSLADKIHRDWSEYLPDISDVIAAVKL